MRIQKSDAAPALRPFVACYWSATLEARPASARNGQVRLVPFLPGPGGLEIFVHLAAPFEIAGARTPLAHVSCWRTTTTGPVSVHGGARLFAIRVRAGMGPQLALPPLPLLADRFTDLADVWGGEGARFAAELCAARGHRERAEIADRFLLSRLRPQRGRAIAWAARQLESGQARIEDLAEASGLGLRQFEARFRAATGNAPARFRRLARLRRNIKALVGHQGSLVEAIDPAYFDQAQQIREFKAFTGMTPGALRAELQGALHFYDLTGQAGRDRTEPSAAAQ